MPVTLKTPAGSTTIELPSWDEMPDIDKGAALRHAWKRSWEGASYAVSDFPCEYVEHPGLVALDSRDACAHAALVTKGLYGRFTSTGVPRSDWRIDVAEEERLTELHRTEGKRILDFRKLWAVRFENGNISECDEEDHARFMVDNTSWRACELLHRDEAGGDWTVIVDARGRDEDCAIGRVRLGDQVFHDGNWVSAAADTVVVNEHAQTEGPFAGDIRRHTFADIDAGHVFYHLLLADGTLIRERKRTHAQDHGEATIRIRRRLPECDR